LRDRLQDSIDISRSGYFLDFVRAALQIFLNGKDWMATPADIGDAVRRARKAMRLRQDELAAAAGVGLRFLVELEHGKPTTQLGKVLLVLDAVGLDLALTPRGGAPSVRP
jgi:y4mF family transcriptional regulator